MILLCATLLSNYLFINRILSSVKFQECSVIVRDHGLFFLPWWCNDPCIKWMRVQQSISGETLKDTVSSAVWSERHMATPSWDESPLSLTIQLALKKTVGIVRGFTLKCDKGNLNWIMIEISAPSRKQMSGITSADLSGGVERLHLLHCDTNGQISAKWTTLKDSAMQ